jgi:hypothetical protein
VEETVITLPSVVAWDLTRNTPWTLAIALQLVTELVLTSPDPSAGISANYIVDEFGNVLADLTGEELVYV